MENKEYKKVENLPKKVAGDVNVAYELGFDIKQKEKEVKVMKEELNPVKERIKDYLVDNGYQGIEHQECKLYLQEGGAVPSFKQVLEEAKDELPKTVVAKLEAKYAELLKENKETRLVIKCS